LLSSETGNHGRSYLAVGLTTYHLELLPLLKDIRRTLDSRLR
jgi:hypothetical protein